MFPRKYRVHIFLATIALVIIFYPSFSHRPDQQRIDASSSAATSFFELVDAGQYKQSWATCSDYLKNKIPEEEWVKNLSAVRSVTGKLLDRKEKDFTYTKKVNEEIPKGEYMEYHFDSQFQNEKHLS